MKGGVKTEVAWKSIMRGFRRFFMDQFNTEFQFKKFHWIDTTLYEKAKDFLSALIELPAGEKA